ncbi:MAG: hypothetical protein ACRDXB_10920, partial [Actinomycetes bacterium]
MDDQPVDPAERQASRTNRGGDGRFTRSPDTAQRDARAAELRGRGNSYRAIASELGYQSPASAHEAVQRALAAIVEEPAQDVRRLELERLDTLYEAALKVLERRHVHVSGGTVVRVRVLGEDGAPIVVGHED